MPLCVGVFCIYKVREGHDGLADDQKVALPLLLKPAYPGEAYDIGGKRDYPDEHQDDQDVEDGKILNPYRKPSLDGIACKLEILL